MSASTGVDARRTSTQSPSSSTSVIRSIIAGIGYPTAMRFASFVAIATLTAALSALSGTDFAQPVEMRMRKK